MNNSFLLPFDRVADKLSEIEYINIDTSDLMLFPLTANAAQQEMVKKNMFNVFTALLPADIKSKPVQFVMFWDKNRIQTCNRAIFYFEDETILPVRFTASEVLNTWIVELLKNTNGTFYFIINAHTCKSHICDESLLINHPFDEMGAWIYKLAPGEYRSSGDANLKAAFMARFKKLNVPQATVDLNNLGQQWLEILTRLNIDVNAPLENQNEYDLFQKETGLSFPEELKLMLSFSNGIGEFLNNTEFLSGKKVLEEWKNWKAIYQSSNYMNLVDEYQYKSRSEKTVPMYVNPFRIPFITDGGGNFIGIDMLPNWAGKIGQIIAFGVDEMAIRCVASDMNDFLQQFLEGKNPMENDKLAKKREIVC